MEIEILYKGFHCVRESRWDRWSNSDEPYFIFTVDDGVDSKVRKVGPFQDVDTGDSVADSSPAQIGLAIWNSTTSGQRRDILIALSVAEDDGNGSSEVETAVSALLGSAGAALGVAVGAGGGLFSAIGKKVGEIIVGADDDNVGTTGLLLSEDELMRLARKTPQFRPDMGIDFNIALTVDGGKEGKYIVFLLAQEVGGQKSRDEIRVVGIGERNDQVIPEQWRMANRERVDLLAASRHTVFGYSRATSLGVDYDVEPRGLRLDDFHVFDNHQTHSLLGPFRHTTRDQATLVTYSSVEGRVTVRSPDLVGTVGSNTGLRPYQVDRTFELGRNWTAMVPGRFSHAAVRDQRMDLLFYRKHDGHQRMISLPRRGKRTLRTNFKNWRRHWDVIAPVVFPGARGFTSLLLYTRGDPNSPQPRGQGQIWRVEDEGDLGSQPAISGGWFATWDFICQVRGNADRIRLLFFSRSRRQVDIWEFPGANLIARQRIDFDVFRIVPQYDWNDFPFVERLMLLV